MGSTRFRPRLLAAAAAASSLVAAGPSPGDAGPDGDPLIPFSTLYGGSSAESDPMMAEGPDGVLWLAFTSHSPDLPGEPDQGILPGDEETDVAGAGDVRVLRFDPVAREVLSSLRLEGVRGTVRGLAVDGEGNAFVLGMTTHTGFPVTAGFSREALEPRDRDAFLARIHPDGSALAWAGLLGGTGDEMPTALALAPGGDPVVYGMTQSDDFPLAAPLQRDRGGDYDLFLARVAADGTALVHSTFIGGDGRDLAGPLAVLPGGAFLLGGETESSDFPAEDRLLSDREGTGGGFLLEVDAQGRSVVRGALLGDSLPWGLLASSGYGILLWGTTTDAEFPAAPPPHGMPGPAGEGSSDVFLARLSPDDWSVGATALYGGPWHERAMSASLGSGGVLWLAGDAPDGEGLPVPGAARALQGSSANAFAAAFDAEDLALLYATHLGGSGQDFGSTVIAAADGTAWVAGTTGSDDFPVVDPLQEGGPSRGSSDLFLCRLGAGDPSSRPGDPSGLAVEPAGNRAARLTWTDGSDDETGFAVYRRSVDALAADDPRKVGFLRVAVLGPDETEWVDRKLSAGFEYEWAVQAFNASGGSAPTERVGLEQGSSLEVRIGEGTQSVAGSRTRLRLRGTLRAGDAVPDPRAEGFGWDLAVPGGDPRTFLVGAGDRRWSGSGRRVRWSDRDLRLVLDRESGDLSLRLRLRGRLAEAGADLPMRIRVGDRSGLAAPAWEDAGRNLLRVR